MVKKRLYNGLEIPDLCFGTGITYGNRIVNVLKMLVRPSRKNYALSIFLPRVIDVCMDNGCHMFDTSRAYGTSEHILGRALKKYNRTDYFIVTKLRNKDQYASDVRGGFEKSLYELGLDYVDLYLMHWPVEGCFLESWKIMEELYKEGKCKAIGVCNCNVHHLEELIQNSDIKPMVNEFECHPLFTQNELRQYCLENDIQVMAYTSTARMDGRLGNTCLAPISKKYNKSIAQVILRWHQQIGNIPIVNSSNPVHMAVNCRINDFTLTPEEIDKITKININSRLRYDPDNCDFTKL